MSWATWVEAAHYNVSQIKTITISKDIKGWNAFLSICIHIFLEFSTFSLKFMLLGNNFFWSTIGKIRYYYFLKLYLSHSRCIHLLWVVSLAMFCSVLFFSGLYLLNFCLVLLKKPISRLISSFSYWNTGIWLSLVFHYWQGTLKTLNFLKLPLDFACVLQNTTKVHDNS